MAQHFFLSSAARTLSLKAIFSAGEEVTYRRFCRLRWPETDRAPVCPACGCANVYDLTTRRRFKCAACHRQFSVTSSTIFASRKRPSSMHASNSTLDGAQPARTAPRTLMPTLLRFQKLVLHGELPAVFTIDLLACFILRQASAPCEIANSASGDASLISSRQDLEPFRRSKSYRGTRR